MRIALVNLTGGGLSGGYQKYLKSTLPLLEQNPFVESLRVYVPSWVINSIHSSSKVHLVNLTDFPKNSWSLRKEVEESKPDVVFIPTARWFNTGSIPCIIMVRNMEPLIDPLGRNNPIDTIKNLIRALTAKQACQKADKIIAVSCFVRDFLVDKWKLPKDKIEVIYHGVDEPSSTGTLIRPGEIPPSFGEDFIFTAGSIRPYRGLEDLIEALGYLKKAGITRKLVIAGGFDPSTKRYKNFLDRLSIKCGIDDQIIWTGNIDAEKMSWCYAHCSEFVMTSRFEACPNVVLEALAHHCLCISTESSPMPEFFKESAIYYPPKNARFLADQLKKIISLPTADKIKMKESAKIRAKDFSWENCSNKTMELILNISEEKHNHKVE